MCSPKATGRGQLWGWERWRRLSGKQERLIQTSSCGFSSNSPGRGHQAGQRRTNDSGWQKGPSSLPPFTFQHPSLHRSRKSHHRLPPRDQGEDPGLHLQAHRSRRTANGKTLEAYTAGHATSSLQTLQRFPKAHRVDIKLFTSPKDICTGTCECCLIWGAGGKVLEGLIKLGIMR